MVLCPRLGLILMTEASRQDRPAAIPVGCRLVAAERRVTAARPSDPTAAPATTPAPMSTRGVDPPPELEELGEMMLPGPDSGARFSKPYAGAALPAKVMAAASADATRGTRMFDPP
jgi:hypothetical protein